MAKSPKPPCEKSGSASSEFWTWSIFGDFERRESGYLNSLSDIGHMLVWPPNWDVGRVSFRIGLKANTCCSCRLFTCFRTFCISLIMSRSWGPVTDRSTSVTKYRNTLVEFVGTSRIPVRPEESVSIQRWRRSLERGDDSPAHRHCSASSSVSRYGSVCIILLLFSKSSSAVE